MTDHKAQSVFAGNIPLWSLQQGGELIFQQILYSFSVYFGGEMGVTLLGLAAVLRSHVLEN